MRTQGIRASELIDQLQLLIEEHGDQEVFAGGNDYPGGVGGVGIQTDRSDPYIPQGTFYVWSRS